MSDLLRPSFIMLLDEKKEHKLQGVEVGVAQGVNAVRMLEYCDRLHLVLVDISISPVVHDKMKQFRERFVIYEEQSVTAANHFENEYFDYIYIDASHEYSDVLQDLRVWYPKIKQGGIFSGHDLDDPGVEKAVIEFFRDKGQRVYGVKTLCPVEPGLEAIELEKRYRTKSSDVVYKMDWWLRKE